MGNSLTDTDRRGKTRVDCPLSVRVQLPAAPLDGQSANVSTDGIYFLAQGPLAVEVSIQTPAGARVVKGKLVRLDSRAHDQVGVAVRLDQSIADLIQTGPK